jgi:predicted RNA-binding protein YlqC (UPF0109 family)
LHSHLVVRSFALSLILQVGKSSAGSRPIQTLEIHNRNSYQQETDEKIIFTLQVAQGDVGKVIGKKGKHANAIRTLIHGVAAKEGKRVVLEIAD